MHTHPLKAFQRAPSPAITLDYPWLDNRRLSWRRQSIAKQNPLLHSAKKSNPGAARLPQFGINRRADSTAHRILCKWLRLTHSAVPYAHRRCDCSGGKVNHEASMLPMADVISGYINHPPLTPAIVPLIKFHWLTTRSFKFAQCRP